MFVIQSTLAQGGSPTTAPSAFSFSFKLYNLPVKSERSVYGPFLLAGLVNFQWRHERVEGGKKYRCSLFFYSLFPCTLYSLQFFKT